METLSSLFLTVILASFPAWTDSPPVQERINSIRGKHELQCWTKMTEGEEVLLLEWTREGLDRYVLLFRDGKVIEKSQHPSFAKRVELQDPDLRSGNLSILLKNISTEDSGVYKCEAQIEISGKRRQVFQSVHLTVNPEKLVEAQSGENVELPCASLSGGAKVLDLRWTREDLNSFLLWNKDGSVEKHPMFLERVELRDPQLSSENLSVLLKNISIQDSGVYKCEAVNQTSDSLQKVLFQFIHLTVKPGMDSSVKGAAQPHVIWGSLLLITAVGVTTFICIWECKKRMDKTQALQTDPKSPTMAPPKSPTFTTPKLSSLDRKGSAAVALLEDPGLFPS